MNDARKIVLSEFRRQCMKELEALKGTGNIDEAFAAWLLGGTYLDRLNLDQAAKKAAAALGAARTYRDVAILGYAICVMADTTLKYPLQNGLEWLAGRQAFASHTPSFEVDGLSLLGIALGAESIGFAKTKVWLAGFLTKSGASRVSSWDKCLIAAVASVIDQPTLVVAPANAELAGLRVALRSHGLNVLSVAGDDIAAIKAVLEAPSDAAFPAVHMVGLRVLDWMLHEACSVDLAKPTIDQVIQLLKRAPACMKRWRWDNNSKGKKGSIVQWQVADEYHVQDLLWVMLAPLFPDLEDEENLPSLGHKHPRADLGIPSLHLIIEAKFIHKGGQAEFAKITEEIAADATLYRTAGSLYENIVAFVWDDSCSIEHHQELEQGLRKMQGIVGAVIMPRPAKMKKE